MKEKIAKISAVFGGGLLSLCCGVPLLLAALGIGGLGLSAFIGSYHWYFTGAGVLAILSGWFFYHRERQRECADGSCEPTQGNGTRNLLIAMSLLMAVFVGLSFYTQFKAPTSIAQNAVHGQLVKIKVEGMTCASCEAHIEHALGKLPGVYKVDASAPSQTVSVDYDPAKCSPKTLEAAIQKTGYKPLGQIQG